MCPNHTYYRSDCSWCRALVRIQLERELLEFVEVETSTHTRRRRTTARDVYRAAATAGEREAEVEWESLLAEYEIEESV